MAYVQSNKPKGTSSGRNICSTQHTPISAATMHLTSILSILLLATLGVQAYKPCADYEVGVGTTQSCGITTDCGLEYSIVVTSDCNNNLGAGWTNDVCASGYSNGWKVSCSGGNPSVVSNTNGQRWGNCYRPSNTACQWTTGVNSIYKTVRYCCKPI